MNIAFRLAMLLLFFYPCLHQAQEIEDSAEFMLEDYTDEFQEQFFEALKQKGIENYDKAINLFLACKLIDPENKVIDHELAKVYLLDKKMVLAESYGKAAVLAEPNNLWYLNTLVHIVLKQGRSLDQIKNQIPYEHVKLKENLALIYYQNNHYKEALEILKDLKQTDFSEDLSQKINDSLKKVAASKKLKELPKKGNDKEISLFDTYKNQITEAQKNVDYVQVLKVATEALESFPVQPYFFYASGLAHNELNNPNEAIKVLEESLDLLLDDSNLNDNIYRELAKAHTAQGNTSKANMYLSKIKSGS